MCVVIPLGVMQITATEKDARADLALHQHPVGGTVDFSNSAEMFSE
jgi:hypothetical protein